MKFFKKLAKAALGFLYLAVPIFGWIALARSIKRVNPGKVALLSKLNGQTKILRAGFHFHPMFGDKFSSSKNLGEDYIQLGPKKIITIKPGFKGVSYDRGELKILNPGMHTLEHAQHTFNPETGFVDTRQDQYTLGPQTHIRIRHGQLGVSYNRGELQILEPGEHVLETVNHQFEKFVPIDDDIIDLGPVKIVNVNEGHVAVLYDKGLLKIIPPGRYHFTLADGQRFSHLLSIKDEVLDLPKIKFMSTDGMEMETDPLLKFRITDPVKAVTKIHNLVQSLVDLAQTTLQNILKRFSLRDLSPAYDIESNNGKKSTNENILKEIHDTFVDDLQAQVSDWGVEIGDLKVKEVKPSSLELQQRVQELGVQTATQDAQRKITQFGIQNQTALITAEAEQTVISAQATREAAMLEASTTADKIKLNAAANAEATVTNAKAEAESTELLATARGNRLKVLGLAAKALTSTTAQQLALGDQDIERIRNTDNPVFYPQNGNFRVWGEKGKQNTFFNNNTAENPISAYLDVATTRETQQGTGPAVIVAAPRK